MERDDKVNFLINLIYYSTVAFLVYLILTFTVKNLLPFLIAGLVAWAVQKPSALIAKKTRIKSTYCAGFLAIFLFALIAFIVFCIMLLIVKFSDNILKFLSANFETVSGFFKGLQIRFEYVVKKFPPEFSSVVNSFYEELPQRLSKTVANFLSNFATDFAKKIPSFLLSCIVSAVASCYIAADFLRLISFVKNLLGTKIFGRILKIKTIFTGSVLSYIKGYLIIMLITFGELTLGFVIFGVKNPVVLGLLISLVDILPVFGTGTVLVPWGITEVLLYNNGRGVGILVIYAIITLVRNLIEPKIIGKQIGINPLFTLIAMFIGLKIFGVTGMFLAPVTLVGTIKYYKEEL